MDLFDIHVHDGRLGLTGAQVAVLLALAVAFAALCIWLVVRIVNRREPWASREVKRRIWGYSLPILLGVGLLLIARYGSRQTSLYLVGALLVGVSVWGLLTARYFCGESVRWPFRSLRVIRNEQRRDTPD